MSEPAAALGVIVFGSRSHAPAWERSLRRSASAPAPPREKMQGCRASGIGVPTRERGNKISHVFEDAAAYAAGKRRQSTGCKGQISPRSI
jgi:hypothetical protein